MTISRLVPAFGLVTALPVALWALPASAQYQAQGYGDAQTVRCDSNDNRYRQCEADNSKRNTGKESGEGSIH